MAHLSRHNGFQRKQRSVALSLSMAALAVALLGGCGRRETAPPGSSQAPATSASAPASGAS
jgi:hypothetical protein